MPIRTLGQKRAGCKPLVFFKGTVEELRKMPLKEIAGAFSVASGRKLDHREESVSVQLEACRRMVIQRAQKRPEALNGSAKAVQFVVLTPIGCAVLQVAWRRGGNIVVHQTPVNHDITGAIYAGNPRNPFDDLKKIVQRGFRTEDAGVGFDNVFHTPAARRLVAAYARPATEPPLAAGDCYSLELMAPFKIHDANYGIVERAELGEILRVNIEPAMGTSKSKLKEKKKFYAKLLNGVPHSLVE